MKFSIIIPVYNVEKYLDKCLNSVLIQSYKNFEVIVVNDGTKDNSQKIIDEYTKKDKRFRSIIKENGGLSDARNFGINEVSGNYLLFLDSDDYIEEQLLQNLYNVIHKKKYDVIKFKINLVDCDSNLLRRESGFSESKEVSLAEMLSQEFCEPAWTYCYNFKFWKSHKFTYAIGKIHEDFGLTPYILWSAKTIYYLNVYGYNYVQRKGSIVNSDENTIKRADDMMFHFDFLKKQLSLDKNVADEDRKLILSFIASALIHTGRILNRKDLKEYIKKLKQKRVFDLILDNTFKRKIKRIIIKYFTYFYIRFIIRS